MSTVPTVAPQGLSVKINSESDVDAIAQYLSQIWGQSFSPAPSFARKKAKLRDVVCRMAGYDDMAAFRRSFTAWEDPDRDEDLPDEVLVSLDVDLNNLVLFEVDYQSYITDRLQQAMHTPDDDEIISLIYSDGFEFSMLGDLDEGAPLVRSNIWRYLLAHYQIEQVGVFLPRIDRYGTPEWSSEDSMREFLRNIGFNQSDHFPKEAQYSPIVELHDTGYDGVEKISLVLTRRK